MIYEMSRDLRGMLRKRRFPYAVHYGPERAKRGAGSRGITFEREPDSVEEPHGQQGNPRKHATRRLGVRATVYAKSSLPSAHQGDHERECEAIVDALIVALAEWGVAARAGRPVFVETRYATAAELAAGEQWPGVVYLIRFTIGRGVYARDYNGAGKPIGIPGNVSSTTRVRYDKQPDSEPEIGCGATP